MSGYVLYLKDVFLMTETSQWGIDTFLTPIVQVGQLRSQLVMELGFKPKQSKCQALLFTETIAS